MRISRWGTGGALAAAALALAGSPAYSAVGDTGTATLTAATVQDFDLGLDRFATALPDQSCDGVEVDDRDAAETYRVEFPATCFEDFLVDSEADGNGYGSLPNPIDVITGVTVDGAVVRLPSELTDRTISTEQFGSAGNGEAFLFRSTSSGCDTIVVEVLPNGAASRNLDIDCGSSGGDTVRPDFADWHLGDVHVHAAGDAALKQNKFCRESGIENSNDRQEEEACAELTMSEAFEIAAANDVEWFILAEHGTWLGMDFADNFLELLDSPGLLLLDEEDRFRGFWDQSVAQDSFELLTQEASDLTATTGIQALMGQELGTATVCDSSGGRGHFSNYFATEIVENFPAQNFRDFSLLSPGDAFSEACDEVGYLQNVQLADGWGAVNHPNAGLHSWQCWRVTDPGCITDAAGGAENFAARTDGGGIDTLRSVEVVTGNEIMGEDTQRDWNRLLLAGRLVSATGGSDGHSNGRTGTAGALEGQNLGIIGGHARTYALYDASYAVSPINEFSSARQAVYSGRTIASNGPLYIPQIEGNFPSNDGARFERQLGLFGGFDEGETVTVRVDWPTDTQWTTIYNNVDEDVPDAQSAIDERRSFSHRPTSLSAFVGSTLEGCDTFDICPNTVQEYEFDLTPQDLARGWAEVEVQLFDYEDIFVYVVGHTNDLAAPEGTLDEDIPDKGFYGAVSSPIWLGIDAAEPEPDPLIGPAPPDGSSFVDLLELLRSSDYDPAEESYIDPSGEVVDQNGQALSNVDIELLVAPSVAGPFQRVTDGSILMSPDNRVNPLLSIDGSFSWSVLPGVYKVQASKPGCVSNVDPTQRHAETEPLVLPPGVTGLELVLDCSTPTTATATLSIAQIDGDPIEGNVVFNVRCVDAIDSISEFGRHTLDVTVGTVDIDNLPVGDTCFYIVDQVPPGLLLDVGKWAGGVVHPTANSWQFFVGSGQTTDELNIEVVNSGTQPSQSDTLAVNVTCNDGSQFNQSIDVGTTATLSPITTGADCTITAAETAGIVVDQPSITTTVLNFGVGDHGQPVPEDGFEWGDQIIIVSAPDNSAPEAIDDSVEVALEAGTVFIDVLANDTDLEGNLDPSTLQIVESANLGTSSVVVIDGTNGVQYEPGPAGDDSFTYQVCDSAGACDVAQVTVAVVSNSDEGGGSGSLPACTALVVDSFQAAPWTFTFQVRNSTSSALDFEFVIPEANYEVTNLVFNGSSQNVTVDQTVNADGTYDIVVSGTLPAWQSVGGQQPNGFQGAITPTSGTPQTNCAAPGSGDNTGDEGGGSGSLPACTALVVDSFQAAPWTFTFQVRNSTSSALDFEFVIPEANYEVTNLVFNGSSQNVTVDQTVNADGTYDIVVSGTLPAWQSVGGQQPNGFQGAITPTSGTPQTNCAPHA